MGDKGGKGFSLPQSNSTLSKDGSIMKGKDDTPVKSKRGRKPKNHVESGSVTKSSLASNSDGKFDSTITRDWSKGGKGDSIGKGKNVPVKKKEDLVLRQEDVPLNAKCMMDCEAAQTMQAIQDHMTVLSKDPTFKIHESFTSGFQYAKDGAEYTNPQSVRRALQNLALYGVSDCEICAIANVNPDTVEEIFALVPSLKSRRSKLEVPVKNVLTELAKLKMQHDEL